MHAREGACLGASPALSQPHPGRGEGGVPVDRESRRGAPCPRPHAIFLVKTPLVYEAQIVMDSQGLVYRLECYSRLIWYRLELIERLGVEHAYVKYLGRLARLYADLG